MVPSFFSLFGSRRDERPDDADAPLAAERPARPRPGARLPQLDAPDDAGPDPEATAADAPAMPRPVEAGEREDDADASDPGSRDAQDHGEPADPTDTAAAGGTEGAPATSTPEDRTRAVLAAADGWRDELLGLGSASTLADLGLLGDAVLDLSHAHPSGLASLYAGRKTQLRNIVREPSALETARHSMRIVQAAATELTHRFGIAPTFLAVGVATWHQPADQALPGVSSGDHLRTAEPGDAATPLAAQLTMADLAPQLQAELSGGAPAPVTPEPPASATLRVPVLLRPVRLLPREGGGDVDLQLEPSVEVNPVFVAALRERGVDVDLTALARSSFGGTGFAPREALLELHELGVSALEGFDLHDSIVVGTFLDPGQVLLDDLAAIRFRLPDSDVLAAVAGDTAARERLRGAQLPALVPGDRDPDEEPGVGDLDAHEQQVLGAVAAGHSLLIDAPVGSHPDRVVAGLLADAAAAGRRTLYLPASKRLGRAVLDRLTAHGLEDVVLQVESDPGWQARAADQLRRSIAAREVELDEDALTGRREELVDVRGRLGRFIEHLHAVREPWGVSVHEVMQQLARLSAASPPPLTGVRLDGDVVVALRGEAGADVRRRLRTAATLGAFSVGPDDTPWYGARLANDTEADAALVRARRLSTETLPRLRAQVEACARETGLRPATSPAAWAEQLHVLGDVAASLDLFVPQVHEQPVDDLVAATAPRAWRKERDVQLSTTQRRDLRRSALELVRPGRSVGDVHAELLRIQAQRTTWDRLASEGGWPRLPRELDAMRATEREVRADLDALADVLAAREEPLTTTGFTDLQALADALAADEEALHDVPPRAATVADLREQGLDALLDDLSARTVPAGLVGEEFDLAWWSSVFQEMVAADPALAGYDGPALGELADRFRELDGAQSASLAGPVRRRVVSRLRELVYADTDTAAELYHSLGSDGGGHLRQAFATWPRLCWALRPVRAVAPMLVPQLLTASSDVDLLVLDHPRQLALAQLAGAVGRSTQVVVVADVRAGLGGAADQLAAVLPSLTLPTDRTDVAPDVMGFLAARGYGDVATVLPTPPGPPRVRLDVLEGDGTTGTPAPGVDAVEAPPAEVEHVVDIVARHAAERPEDSLGVVALGERHAVALRAGLRRRAREDDVLHRFLTAQPLENVVAVGAHDAAGLRRDRVILSVGYGKTVHGRVLHRFGPVSEAGGRATLVEVLAAVRHELIVVSCLAPGEILGERVQAPGTQMLVELLEAAATGTLLGAEAAEGHQLALALDAPAASGRDQLRADLAERLTAAGLRVVAGFGVSGAHAAVDAAAVDLPLAVGPAQAEDGLAVAVLGDDEAYVEQGSLRTRDRHVLETLERRGWAVHRAFSAALFLDQAQQVDQVAELTARVREARNAEGGRVVRLAVATERARAGTTAGLAGPSEAGPSDAAPDPTPVTDARADDDVPTVPSADPTERPAGDGHSSPERREGRAPRDPDAVVRRPERPQPLPRGRRPDVPVGAGLANYTDAQLAAMVRWIVADRLPRTEGQVVTELRAHLAIRDTGNAARAVLTRAAREGNT